MTTNQKWRVANWEQARGAKHESESTTTRQTHKGVSHSVGLSRGGVQLS